MLLLIFGLPLGNHVDRLGGYRPQGLRRDGERLIGAGDDFSHAGWRRCSANRRLGRCRLPLRGTSFEGAQPVVDIADKLIETLVNLVDAVV